MDLNEFFSTEINQLKISVNKHFTEILYTDVHVESHNYMKLQTWAQHV
jgi:hypothetical protein